MSKLFWVVLPLLAAGSLLAWQVLRRRTPSRQALNIGASLLLLTYVATTAGLGIFWVANQQLPVFDWHYLFGYATVLLLVLHLSFNWRIVWRYLTRSREASLSRAAAAERGARRNVLGLVGALLASGAAFFLGMRHGRSDLRLEWPAPDSAAGAAEGPQRSAAMLLVERYHAYSSQSRSGVLLRAPGVDWGDPPAPFKRYPLAPRIGLPAPGTAPGSPFDLAALSAALWHTAGITASRATLELRAAPSSGALFATELYVATRAVAGLGPGLWHYDALTHALEKLADGPLADTQLGAPGEPALRDALAIVIATAVFRRSGHKYRDRTYRYVLADLGHALENLRVATLAAAAQPHFVMRFDEARCAATLQLDQAEEGVLALLAMRPPDAPATVDAGPLAPGWSMPPAPSQAQAPLGATGAMHAATSLRAALPHGPSSVPSAPAAAPAPGPVRLPAVVPIHADVFEVIAARRSMRRFAATPLSRELLSGVLAGMVAAPVWPPSRALRVDVVVHGVTDLPPGVYRHEPASRTLQPRRAHIELRRAARAAALDQDVIGDAAVVFVLSIDRDALNSDPVGPARGYRHALLRAGCVGERIYLEAGKRGLAACAVGAFYDDEASALVAGDPAREWVVHFAALGVPA